ncbi:hypothetical protein ABGB12_31010 [Actinocorallia sp. B10E7]|uniref:hypothetical protein n=1 Tax=Actinocorallia sp. B10E7 TaxID=3153558 RepID=UPI00325E9FFA
MTTGAGGSEPVDLRSLRATDTLFDRLADRRPDPAGDQDAAVRLLRALLEDVAVAEEPPEPLEGRRPVEPSLDPAEPAAARRSGGTLGVRAAVAVGFASAVLAAGGVAAGWEPGEGRSAGAGIKSGPALPDPGQERPPDSRPSSLSITPST